MRVFAALIFLAFGALRATATVIEVPVPELVGTYVHSSRTATVHLPSAASVIHGVSLRLRGTTSFSSWSCDGSAGYGPPGAQNVEFLAEFVANPGYWFSGQQFAAAGAVDVTRVFEPIPSFDNPRINPTWDFLADGSAEIFFGCSGEPPILECFRVGPEEMTELTEVTLLVDGEFATPASTTSWGMVKAIYR